MTTGGYRPRYEAIAEALVGMIRVSGLSDGDRLPTEMALSEQLGVSRAVVHDAVKLLAAQGLVRSRRGSGLFVGAPTLATKPVAVQPAAPERMQDLFAFREEIEALTTRFAAARLSIAELRTLDVLVSDGRAAAARGDQEAFLVTDSAFHHTIAEATHNPFFVETVSTILAAQRWAVRLITGGAPGSLARSAAEHAAVVAGFRDGQAAVAEQAMRAHVQSVFDAYRAAAHIRLVGGE